MNRDSGWFFDIYVAGNQAVLWVKREDGRMLRITDAYAPFFHVKAVDTEAERHLLFHLPECDGVRRAFLEQKKTSLETAEESTVVRVETDGPKSFKALVDAVETSRFVERAYGVDFRHSQRYLLTALKVEPTSKVVVEHENGRLVNMKKVDDSRELVPPPFTMLRFRIGYESYGGRKGITRIDTVYKKEERAFEGSESEIITSFVEHVNQANPDIVFCPKCDEFTFPLLQERARSNNVELRLGRSFDGEQVKAQGSFGGRAVLGDVFYGYTSDDWGIAGLVERSRFAFLPIGLATRWKSNKSIDSRNSFELMERGYVIPRENYFESVRSLMELVRRDRGGITITPELGIHENVAALDFDSEFPNIIMRDGLSYEGNGYGEDHAFRLIPTVIAPFTNRRLWLKRLKKTFPKGSDLRRYCEQRIETLKMIAVTQYGIAGCCWNRLGNVLTFEAINRASREAMIKAKQTAESEGYRIIYGDVDSLFVQKPGATKEDYEALAARIAQVSKLPMSLDRHFRFVGFLPLRSDANSSALKRYFGLTFDGEVEARGIELRRSDTPKLVREFQIYLIGQMLDCTSLAEVYSVGLERGREITRKSIALVDGGKIPDEMLIVNKTLRKSVGEYRVSVTHRSAAVQLLAIGQDVEVGDSIQFIYANAEHPNPLCRVSLPGHSGNYDRRTYCKLIEEAAKTVFNAVGAELFPKEDPLQTCLS